MPKVVLRAADGATAEVFLQGAHVSSWRPSSGDEERLFLSASSRFATGVAIRGGIPVIFPQFAAEGPLPRHGFARTAQWSLAQLDESGSIAFATFVLEASPQTQSIWPADFLATLNVRVGGDRLAVELAVENHGTAPFSFNAALHTYLRVNDVSRIELLGLEGTSYRESGTQGGLLNVDEHTLRVEGEIDRVYVNAPSVLVLRDPDPRFEIGAHGFPDVVVWNPGAKLAATLNDMESHGEQRMLCVEAAAVQTPIVLAPGAQWAGAQTLVAL